MYVFDKSVTVSIQWYGGSQVRGRSLFYTITGRVDVIFRINHGRSFLFESSRIDRKHVSHQLAHTCECQPYKNSRCLQRDQVVTPTLPPLLHLPCPLSPPHPLKSPAQPSDSSAACAQIVAFFCRGRAEDCLRLP